MSGWGDVFVGLASGTVGTGGVGALLLVRANRRKTDADAGLVIQEAAAKAVTTVQRVADETQRELREALKESREENKQLKAEFAQVRSDLLQARTEMEQLRAQASVERQQLLDQLATERAAHETAMAAVRHQLAQTQARKLANGIGRLLDDDFPGASGL